MSDIDWAIEVCVDLLRRRGDGMQLEQYYYRYRVNIQGASLRRADFRQAVAHAADSRAIPHWEQIRPHLQRHPEVEEVGGGWYRHGPSLARMEALAVTRNATRDAQNRRRRKFKRRREASEKTAAGLVDLLARVVLLDPDTPGWMETVFSLRQLGLAVQANPFLLLHADVVALAGTDPALVVAARGCVVEAA